MIDSQALLTKGRELPWVGVRAASFGTKMGGKRQDIVLFNLCQCYNSDKTASDITKQAQVTSTIRESCKYIKRNRNPAAYY